MENAKPNKTETRSFLSTMVAIAWSFIGLRRKRDFDEDVGRLNPFYVVFGALIGTALFIGMLLTIAYSVVSSSVQ